MNLLHELGKRLPDDFEFGDLARKIVVLCILVIPLTVIPGVKIYMDYQTIQEQARTIAELKTQSDQYVATIKEQDKKLAKLTAGGDPEREYYRGINDATAFFFSYMQKNAPKVALEMFGISTPDDVIAGANMFTQEAHERGWYEQPSEGFEYK